MAERREIVIVGGGIIGCTTAYYLTRHPRFNPALHSITILEAAPAVAAGASGKAGGLLGLWAYPACLVPLSYRLHAELAAEHDGAARWGYRAVGCGSVSAKVSKQKLDSMRAARESQSSTAAAAENGGAGQQKVDDSGDGNGKEWEKLPKQDDAARQLLQDPANLPADLHWIDTDVARSWSQMGPPGATDTAQVHPFHFTTAMAALAQENGARLLTHAQVTALKTSSSSSSSSSSASGNGIEAVEYIDRTTGERRTMKRVTDVVVAAGPWSGGVLPRSRVEGLRAHSVVFEAELSPYAVFTDVELPGGWVPEHRAREGKRRMHRGRVDPEIYARPFGEAYACGEPDSIVPLPETADQVQFDEAQCDDLISYIATVSAVLGSSPVKAKQACYLPQHIRFGKESDPLVGPTMVPGLWIAAGHTCWGIQNGPATGKLMAEYILDGRATSADIEKLDPRKFKV